MNYKIFWDGYSSPHKHNKAGWAIVIKEGNKTIFTEIGTLPPDTTNNQAELMGLVKAIRRALEGPLRGLEGTSNPMYEVRLLGDSKLIVDAFNGVFIFKNQKLRQMLSNLKVILPEKIGFTVGWVPRAKNLAGKLIERRQKDGDDKG